MALNYATPAMGKRRTCAYPKLKPGRIGAFVMQATYERRPSGRGY
jgi:hypothetical protein